jgi:hypothetical protein
MARAVVKDRNGHAGNVDIALRRIRRSLVSRADLQSPKVRDSSVASMQLHCTPMGTAGRYTIELFQLGGAGAGMEVVLDANDRLDAARALYRIAVAQYPGRLIMLCERARVLARSDRPDSPWTIEDDGFCFIVRDHNGQALAYVDRRRLEAIVLDRSAPQKHVWRNRRPWR